MGALALANLTLWAVIVTGGSFRVYAWTLPAALALGAAAAVWLGARSSARAPPPPVPETSTPDPEQNVRWMDRTGPRIALLAALLVALYLLPTDLPVLVLLPFAFLLAVRWPAPGHLQDTHTPPFSSTHENPWPWLAAALVIAIGYTLASHRPDGDDGFYLFYGLLPLDRPDEPFRQLSAGLWQQREMLTSYPVLGAAIADWTGLDFLSAYYLVVPAGMAALCVLAHRSLFEQISREHAALLTLMTVILLVLWGDVHRSPGNFAFVRLFQGKAMFYAVLVPWFLGAVLGLLNHAPGSGSRLATATVVAIGFTHSAIVLIPVFFAALIASQMCAGGRGGLRSGQMRGLMVALAIALAVVLVLIVHTSRIPFNLRVPVPLENLMSTPMAALGALIGQIDAPRLHHALTFVFGDSLRGLVGFAGLALIPLFARDAAHHRALVVLVASIVLIALNPVLVELTERITSSLAWRLQWMFPIAAVLAAAIFLLAHRLAHGAPRLRLALCALALLGFALLGQTTFSEKNGNRLGTPGIKPALEESGALIKRPRIHREFGPLFRDGRICLSHGCY